MAVEDTKVFDKGRKNAYLIPQRMISALNHCSVALGKLIGDSISTW